MDRCAHCSEPQACSPGLPGALSITPAAVGSLAWVARQRCANGPAVERMGAGAGADREGPGGELGTLTALDGRLEVERRFCGQI